MKKKAAMKNEGHKQQKMKEIYSRFYRSLYRIRRAEEEIARLYPSDKIKSPVHLSIGQEAVSVGVCEALRKDDVVFGTYRGHAMYLAKGGDLKRMFAELYGKETGCAKGKGGSMHLVEPSIGVMGTSAIVGTTIPIAAGYAYAMQCRGSDSVVVAFFGDGAVDEGAFHEAMNIAAMKNLPLLFVCENNSYAIHSHHLSRHHSDNLCERAKSYGVPAERIGDGDIFKTFHAAQDFIERLRKGKGPAFLECITCRWKEHVGTGDDFHLGYRSEAEVQEWKEKDAVIVVKRLLPEEITDGIHDGVEREIEEAIRFAEESPFPGVTSLHEHVYKVT